MMTDLTKNTFDHVPNMQDRLEKYPNFEEYHLLGYDAV
jgi:hypothetical protein